MTNRYTCDYNDVQCRINDSSGEYESKDDCDNKCYFKYVWDDTNNKCVTLGLGEAGDYNSVYDCNKANPMPSYDCVVEPTTKQPVCRRPVNCKDGSSECYSGKYQTLDDCANNCSTRYDYDVGSDRCMRMRVGESGRYKTLGECQLDHPRYTCAMNENNEAQCVVATTDGEYQNIESCENKCFVEYNYDFGSDKCVKTQVGKHGKYKTLQQCSEYASSTKLYLVVGLIGVVLVGMVMILTRTSSSPKST